MAYPATNLYPQVSGLYPGDGVEVIPTVVTGVSSSVGLTLATVAGTVNPNGLSTHYYFEYSLAPRYDDGHNPPTFFGARSSLGDAGSGTSAAAVSANLTGLATGRTYYYTLVAYNSAGYAYGAQRSFDTLVSDLAEFLPELIHSADRGQ